MCFWDILVLCVYEKTFLTLVATLQAGNLHYIPPNDGSGGIADFLENSNGASCIPTIREKSQSVERRRTMTHVHERRRQLLAILPNQVEDSFGSCDWCPRNGKCHLTGKKKCDPFLGYCAPIIIAVRRREVRICYCRRFGWCASVDFLGNRKFVLFEKGIWSGPNSSSFG